VLEPPLTYEDGGERVTTTYEVVVGG